jgi:chromosome transmission fidelity protein 1
VALHQRASSSSSSSSSSFSAAAAAPGGAGGSTGREYYENLCLRVVNQSIGRSIRHVGDHAVILLLDARYSQPHIRAKLPGWMADRVTLHPAWGSVAAGVGAFFRRKREALAAQQANRH